MFALISSFQIEIRIGWCLMCCRALVKVWEESPRFWRLPMLVKKAWIFGCDDNRPHRSVSYWAPINKTRCSTLGLCRAHVGRMLAHVVSMLGRAGHMFSHDGPMLRHVERFCAHVGLMLRHAGPLWPNVGPILGLCWARVGPMLGLCWAMLRPSLAI